MNVPAHSVMSWRRNPMPNWIGVRAGSGLRHHTRISIGTPASMS
ncbi:MAG: hypothetical protein R3F34_16790 [Planctomycetota bacterium]